MNNFTDLTKKAVSLSTLKSDAQAFCDACQWAYECWVTHANFFDALFQGSEISCRDFVDTPSGRCLGRLNEISREYVILQIAKLHDPANQGRNANLSVDYFVNQCAWSEEDKSRIEQIVTKLEQFASHIRVARDKIIVHNDRSISVKNELLGDFPLGMDELYFQALGELASLIWGKWLRTSNPWSNRVFNFTKSGLDNDAFCPANDAKKIP